MLFIFIDLFIYLVIYSIFLIPSFKLLVYKYAVCRTRIAKNDLEITIPNRVHSSKNVPNILKKGSRSLEVKLI